MSISAKVEFLSHLSQVGNKEVLCAFIKKQSWTHSKVVECVLTTGWDSDDWNSFLSKLDFDYNCGYGEQVLYGNIWYDVGVKGESMMVVNGGNINIVLLYRMF